MAEKETKRVVVGAIGGETDGRPDGRQTEEEEDGRTNERTKEGRKERTGGQTSRQTGKRTDRHVSFLCRRLLSFDKNPVVPKSTIQRRPTTFVITVCSTLYYSSRKTLAKSYEGVYSPSSNQVFSFPLLSLSLSPSPSPAPSLSHSQ